MTFDESVPALVKVLLGSLDKSAVEAGTILRDTTGCLAFFAAAPIPLDVAEQLRATLERDLGPYARPDRVLAQPDAPGSLQVRESTACVFRTGDCQLRVVDRRIVGADWLQSPPEGTNGPESTSKRAPRVAFASLKGGVGRSTALSIVAAQLAESGRNVLVVDLDLEAPGVGTLLVPAAEMPKLGVIDYLVELNFGPVTIPIDDFIVTRFTLRGVVDVVPVAGSRSEASPENYMAKLARAMTEALPVDGPPVSLVGKVRVMLEALEARRPYDVILLDARAGLAEVTAAPLVGLDADVLLFGTMQRQTLDDLRFLLAHLATLPRRRAPWPTLKMVHAKAQKEASIREFNESLWELFGDYLYEKESEGAPLDAFNFDVDDQEAPHFPLIVPFETAFQDYDPFISPSPAAPYFERTFGAVKDYVERRITAS